MKISAGAAAARCDDTAALKSCIIDYLLEDTEASRRLGLNRKGKKADRGFNHPVSAALLCPIKYEASQEYAQIFEVRQRFILILPLKC